MPCENARKMDIDGIKRDFGFLMERFKVERYEIEKMKDGCTNEEMS